jgi:hypothetical protein
MIITNFVPCSIGKSALMAQPGLHIDLGAKLAALWAGDRLPLSRGSADAPSFVRSHSCHQRNYIIRAA